MSKHVSCDIQVIYLHHDVLQRYISCIICTTTRYFFLLLCKCHGHSCTPLDILLCCRGKSHWGSFILLPIQMLYFRAQKAIEGLRTITFKPKSSCSCPAPIGSLWTIHRLFLLHYTQKTSTYRKSLGASLWSVEQHISKRKLWNLVSMPLRIEWFHYSVVLVSSSNPVALTELRFVAI